MTCECTDPGCREHPGRPVCRRRAEIVVSRPDYGPPPPRFRFCDGCAADAGDSGAFTFEGVMR